MCPTGPPGREAALNKPDEDEVFLGSVLSGEGGESGASGVEAVYC